MAGQVSVVVLVTIICVVLPHIQGSPVRHPPVQSPQRSPALPMPQDAPGLIIARGFDNPSDPMPPASGDPFAGYFRDLMPVDFDPRPCGIDHMQYMMCKGWGPVHGFRDDGSYFVDCPKCELGFACPLAHCALDPNCKTFREKYFTHPYNPNQQCPDCQECVEWYVHLAPTPDPWNPDYGDYRNPWGDDPMMGPRRQRPVDYQYDSGLDPLPSGPMPSGTMSSGPMPSGPMPVGPEPANPMPVEPKPVDPEPIPTEPKPADAVPEGTMAPGPSQENPEPASSVPEDRARNSDSTGDEEVDPRLWPEGTGSSTRPSQQDTTEGLPSEEGEKQASGTEPQNAFPAEQTPDLVTPDTQEQDGKPEKEDSTVVHQPTTEAISPSVDGDSPSDGNGGTEGTDNFQTGSTSADDQQRADDGSQTGEEGAQSVIDEPSTDGPSGTHSSPEEAPVDGNSSTVDSSQPGKNPPSDGELLVEPIPVRTQDANTGSSSLVNVRSEVENDQASTGQTGNADRDPTEKEEKEEERFREPLMEDEIPVPANEGTDTDQGNQGQGQGRGTNPDSELAPGVIILAGDTVIPHGIHVDLDTPRSHDPTTDEDTDADQGNRDQGQGKAEGQSSLPTGMHLPPGAISLEGDTVTPIPR